MCDIYWDNHFGKSCWIYITRWRRWHHTNSTQYCCTHQGDSLENIFTASWNVKYPLTHWSWVTHICVGKLTNIGSDNGLPPGRRQAIIWTNAGILLIGPLGTNFSGILIVINTFSFMKMHLKMASAKWRPFCLGLNVLYMIIIYAVVTWAKVCSNELISPGQNGHYFADDIFKCIFMNIAISIKFVCRG